MKNKLRISALFCGTLIFFSMSSCTVVKDYQKNKINDADMALGSRKVAKTELNFQTYREASSGANSGKVGGGCGCN